MNERRVHTYVAVMCLSGLICLGLTDWSTLAALPPESVLGLGGLIAIALLSESLAIGLNVGSGRSSITFLPLLASVQLFGPAGGVALILPSMGFVEFVVRRKPLVKGLFNVSMVVVATTVAGAVFVLAGGVPLEVVGDVGLGSQLVPFISFGLAFLVVNHAAVSLVFTLSQGLPFRRVWDTVLSNSGARLNDILISPIALAVAFLYVSFGIAGIVVILLPMLFVRYSYLTTSKLREANEDLLTALVKAIETRDPYTSGHSQRVSALAGRIAEQMGLNRAAIERVKMAALLHDIGKIEAVYTDILRKPDSLTDEERTIIESHVTRGEQLLRDLSSVPEEVVKSVRHHHEREDGRGYPDGLKGPTIPLGAKIISVCDAVDAMLSDRPYRKALSLRVVEDQLEQHSGTQFDRNVVEAVLGSDILPEYAQTMRGVREETDPVSVPYGDVVTPLPAPSLRVARLQRLRRYH